MKLQSEKPFLRYFYFEVILQTADNYLIKGFIKNKKNWL